MNRPNLFVIGLTKIGKSPLAAHLARALGLAAISGSEWVKARYTPRADNMTAYVAELTSYTCRTLAVDPDACVDFIRGKYEVNKGGYVVEGLRNPRDFTLLFRPDVDIVLFLEFARNEFQPTRFEERGVAAIHANVEWMTENKIVARQRVLRYKINSLRGKAGHFTETSTIPGDVAAVPCWNLDECMALAAYALKNSFSPCHSKEHVHANLAPFHALVETQVLYNNDGREGSTPCTIFGVSSYAGHAPTFNVLLANGSVFSYVPVHRLRTGDVTDAMDLTDLVYHDCPSERIVVTAYDALQRPLRAYFAKLDRWVDAKYVATVDWYTGNNLLHLLTLANGQFAMLPSHKVLFSDGGELPDYKKLRAEWKVGKVPTDGDVG